MGLSWFSSDFTHDRYILAGDIGGTNANIAIVGEKNGKLTIIFEAVYKSGEINDLAGKLRKIIGIAVKKSPKLKPVICCISGAGPVENNSCKLTNLDWGIDGAEIEKEIKTDTIVINDFVAVGYGIPILDVDDPEQVTRLPHPDGSVPGPEKGAVKAAVGAGTGLGVSYIASFDGKYRVYPSEGGHSGFDGTDEESVRIKTYVTNKLGMVPGAEQFVSGQGIINIYNYYKSQGQIEPADIFQKIEAVSDRDKPALISKNAVNSIICRKIMQVFIRMYGTFSSNVAIMFMALGGLYLAGGIAAKNEPIFLEDHVFMKSFAANYKDSIRKLLQKIPVYIVKDYSISLSGAANAAVICSRGK